jgi:RHS repeat-associated protein
LIREDNGWLNKTITYTYDANGNIQTKKEYPYTTGSLGEATHVYNYQYNNSSDSNQLTSHDGNELTYDGNGNLTSYNGSTYSWNGNNLNSIANANDQISYQYNDKGVRTSKTVNGKTTTFTLDNKYNVASQTDGTNTLTFTYDMYNCLAAMTFNGTKYTYEKDAQGDIIGLFDSSNNEVVKYSYDSWGKLISIDGSLADTIGKANPFRYRSYYYDFESQLYYLQSRYYNPEIGRFISKDDSGYHDANNLIDSNLYAYVDNNPVINTDPNGHVVFTAIGTGFGALFGWLSAEVTGGDPKAGAVSGAFGGMLTGMGADFAAWTGGSGILVTAILGAASSVVTQIIYKKMTEKNVDVKYFLKPDVAGELLFDAAVGAVFNVCGSAWVNSLKYGQEPPIQAKILQKVLSFCHTDLDEIEDTIVVNKVIGIRQVLIDAVYEYLKKNR